MGVQEIRSSGGDSERVFKRRVLDDLRALESMIDAGMIERDRRRIGAEQELVLVDADLHPAPVSGELMDRIADPRVTTEIARFNLEFNSDPVELAPDCFARLRAQFEELLGAVDRAGAAIGVRALLTGICPTLELSHLSTDNITPKPRYAALDEALRRLRGTDYELRVKGADELTLRHPSVMLEALNTSFQVHYQVSAEEFAGVYNLAQLIAAPVLAACVNSPVLFGKRLWRETRIAILQQVVDTRADTPHEREMLARVRFGEDWVQRSVLELFRHDVARFRMLLAAEEHQDALAELEAGRIPRLRALQAFNSTVYRWNRACYGITDGKPHLRIENRLLPAGPTIDDEIANAALWIGLLLANPWRDIPERMDFKDARGNFMRAAREGLSSHLVWLDGQEVSAPDLILEQLVPAARRGLATIGLPEAEIDGILGIITGRVRSRQTGAAWTLRTVAAMQGRGTRAERLHRLTEAMLEGQASGRPVHEWNVANLEETGDWRRNYLTVGQYMSTNLYTVAEDECIDLAASIMDWERLRHVPVEDSANRLVGLVSYRTLLRLMAQQRRGEPDEPIAVSEVMIRIPVTVSPSTPTLEAIELMREHGVSCLPVVEHGRLVGIVSERDYVGVARKLLEQSFRERDRSRETGDPAP